MIILVINCGSSSIKYQLLDMRSETDFDLRAKGNLERISLPEARLKHCPTGGDVVEIKKYVPDHRMGMEMVLSALTDPVHGVLSSLEDIDAVGHRIVHGGEFFDGSAIVNDDVLEKIRICCDFAPLHNPAHLLGIKAVTEVLPKVAQVVTFDTAYHQTMPAYAYMYALPYKYYEKYRVRRYGAHGTSHRYVAFRGAEVVGIPVQGSRIITCHLGNGSSVSAIVDGKVIDTSMGFTPLEGMIMGTRCGNIDANIVPYLMKKEGISPDEMTEIMNKKSGFIGLSEKSSDTRDMCDLRAQGDERATLVLDKFIHDLVKNVGMFVAEMNGVDLIVFTGGIGENNAWVREDVCKFFTHLGLKFDTKANAVRGVEAVLSAPDSAVKVALIPTDEELMIARDTMRLVSAL